MNEVSREAAKARSDPDELSAIVVDCAYPLHVEVGPGLLESVYEAVLARMLGMPLGLPFNFGAATVKEGIRRIVNQHRDFASSRLRVNRNRPTQDS